MFAQLSPHPDKKQNRADYAFPDDSVVSKPSLLRNTTIIEQITALLVLLILFLYSFMYLSNSPYTGFVMNANYIVEDIFVVADSPAQLMVGDRVLNFTEYPVNKSNSEVFSFFREELKPGDSVDLMVERGGSEIPVQWTIPGFNTPEFIYRLSYIWIPYGFWIFGMLTAFLIRPKDERWRVLVTYDYLSAIWLVALIASTVGILTSPELYRVIMWLCIPIYLHLGWVFPKSLGDLPKLIVIGISVFAFVMVLAEFYFNLPAYAAMVGLGIAVICSILLVVIHWVRQPKQRKIVRLILSSYLLASVPTLIIGLFLITGNPVPFSGRILLALPIVPAVYFLVIARTQMSDLEVRTNRAITQLVFGFLIFITFFPIIILARAIFFTASINLSYTLLLIVIASVAAVSLYPFFQRIIERFFLGISMKTDKLLEDYAAQITTRMDLKQLVKLLRHEVFPSLLIQEAVLLSVEQSRREGVNDVSTILAITPQENAIPDAVDIPVILRRAGRYIPKPLNDQAGSEPFTWVRLVLPLHVEQNLIGLCLLGKRDPDDYYSPSEIRALRAIMNQTALVLVHIEQEKYLHTLYQDDINRQEMERKKIARDLHDVVLNDLALLGQSMDGEDGNGNFDRIYERTVHHIREIIGNLRPAMLHYGLHPALDALVDDLYALPVRPEHDCPHIELTVSPSQLRYPDKVELHIFRIIQQACENALKHANAKNIRIMGKMTEDTIGLLVQDDGEGFQSDRSMDLASLLVKRHYGLVGMYERAALIDATIDFRSNNGSGTTVILFWQRESDESGKS